MFAAYGGDPDALFDVAMLIVPRLEAKLADKACRQFASNALERIRVRSTAARTDA